MPPTDSSQKSPLDELTEKQREALDLLIQHKTSKEIGRILSISPHTADQRIQVCREKLGVNSRSELAVEYLRLRSIYEPLTYEESRMASAVLSFEKDAGSDEERSLVLKGSKRSKSVNNFEHASDYRVTPEMFEGIYGTLFRLGTSVIFSVLLIILVLGGISLFSETSELVGN